jgi:hypothetical protein
MAARLAEPSHDVVRLRCEPIPSVGCIVRGGAPEGKRKWKLQARGQDEGDDHVDARGQRVAAPGSQATLGRRSPADPSHCQSIHRSAAGPMAESYPMMASHPSRSRVKRAGNRQEAVGAPPARRRRTRADPAGADGDRSGCSQLASSDGSGFAGSIGSTMLNNTIDDATERRPRRYDANQFPRTLALETSYTMPNVTAPALMRRYDFRAGQVAR